MSGARPENILVIKLGALGDFVQAFGPFAAIRRHHPDAWITLLTTRPYADFARGLPWFDAVQIDARPKALDVSGWLGLRQFLTSGGFSRVYDLQTSDRSSGYLKLFWPGRKPEWSGIARGCSHPHRNPDRDLMHTIERQAEQLHDAGITDVPPPGYDGPCGGVADFRLPERFALFAPGGAAHRPAKRWPAASYAALARKLSDQGITPLLLGGEDERALHARITDAGDAVSLCGRTDFFNIMALARRAEIAVGNDTGPMHLVAVTGCPSVVLFSSESDPALCAPRGETVEVLRENRLSDLTVDAVLATALQIERTKT
jgi:ADP-heptose:LPS heptosyltransferase